MATKLSDFEKGESFEGDYDNALKDAQERLACAHFAHIVHGKRTVIAFEGWDAAGKGGIIRRMVGRWEPRFYQVWPIGAPTAEEKARHFLWRFWKRLPGNREIAIFDRSWYGRVLVERVEGYCSAAEWKRGYDEINEFEAQQIDGGTGLIKIFLHVTQKEQDDRLAKRLKEPGKRWKITAEDFRNRERREDYLAAIDDMLEQTDTRWAPWAVFDGNNKKSARIAVMNHVAEKLETLVPSTFPDLELEIESLAKKAGLID